MSKFECDCGGKFTEHSADVRVCQKCKKIPNMDTLLEILEEIGVKEDTLQKLKNDVNYVPV